jgi:hypothetical protein
MLSIWIPSYRFLILFLFVGVGKFSFMEMAIQKDATELNHGRSTEQIAHEEQLQQ